MITIKFEFQVLLKTKVMLSSYKHFPSQFRLVKDISMSLGKLIIIDNQLDDTSITRVMGTLKPVYKQLFQISSTFKQLHLIRTKIFIANSAYTNVTGV